MLGDVITITLQDDGWSLLAEGSMFLHLRHGPLAMHAATSAVHLSHLLLTAVVSWFIVTAVLVCIISVFLIVVVVLSPLLED